MRPSSKQTIHFVYILPAEKRRFWQAYNTIALKYGILEPRYRFCRESIIWPEPTCSPFSITRYFTQALERDFNVRLYDWNERGCCKVKPGDVLLYHPLPEAGYEHKPESEWTDCNKSSIAWRTLEKYPEMKSVMIVPYTHDATGGWLRSSLRASSGRMIAICGRYWTDSWEQSLYRDQVKKLLQIDMSVQASSYSRVKRSFNPPGKRKLLYVGHTGLYKNTAQLEAIAQGMPQIEMAHIGVGIIKGWRKVAESLEFTPSVMQRIADEFDIFVSCSSADAQPTTILEQMCVGLAIAATKESGINYPSFSTLSVSNTAHNVSVLNQLQVLDARELLRRADENRVIVERQHSWETFSAKIISFLKQELTAM